MALLKTRGERPVEEPLQPTPTDAIARLQRTSGPATTIDEASELEGILRCKDTVRLAGKVKGEVHCDQTVVVANTARVRGNIEAESVVVSGEVRGDIAARRKITLEKTAQVTGDLKTPGIVIEEGAQLEGRIVIGAEQGAEAKSRTTAKPAAAQAKSAPAQTSPPPTS